jgi:2-polyprenyl-6-methoxyphenol hydroxylase-like FAD-dependent oxidoreductase
MSAIEDAEALSIHLPKLASSSDTKAINEVLQHVFRVRYKRASLCQTRSRAMGLLASEKIGKQSSDELFELWMYPGAAQWELERPDMILPE